MTKPAHPLRFVFAAVACLTVALVAALTLTSGDAATGQVPSAGCVGHELRYGVTDSATEATAQRRFENTLTDGGAALPRPGLYSSSPPAAATLHAASHGYVVIFYRASPAPEGLEALRRLDAVARRTQAPVLIAPRRQRSALSVIAGGMQTACRAGGAAQVRSVRAIAASMYPSVEGA